MLKSTRRQIILATTAAMLLPNQACANPPKVTFGTIFSRLSKDAKSLVDTNNVAGIAVGLSNGHDRKTVGFGFADIAKKTAVTEMTPFRIASLTKAFTAVSILKLVELGKFSLDQTIDLYFPDYPRANQVTIYHLLTHTSGIPNWWGRLPDTAPANFMSSGRAHQWLAKLDESYLFAPGTQHDYSNSGYVLLGEVIEKVTGLSFETALRRLVLSKFGALATKMENPNTPKAGWATGYSVSGGTLVQSGFEPMPFAAGGLRSCLNDMLSFSDALFQGKLLHANSLKAMTAHAKLSDGRLVEKGRYAPPGANPAQVFADTTEMGYGFGVNTWVQSGERFYSHAGLISGFGAYWIHAPRTKITAVILTNTQGGTSPIHEALRQSLIKA